MCFKKILLLFNSTCTYHLRFGPPAHYKHQFSESQTCCGTSWKDTKAAQYIITSWTWKLSYCQIQTHPSIQSSSESLLSIFILFYSIPLNYIPFPSILFSFYLTTTHRCILIKAFCLQAAMLLYLMNFLTMEKILSKTYFACCM